MGTKTIGITEDVYDRLKARKRADESFTELVDRLLEASTPDWRDGFGSLPAEDAEELERAVESSRSATSAGLAGRQNRSLETMGSGDDEAP